MSQIPQLIGALKKALKARNMTYEQVAQALELSTASVKRLFSDQQLSLQRLEDILALLDMDISDLVQQMNAEKQRTQFLTLEQEREIAEDLVLLLVTVSVLNRWTLENIVEYYHLSETECLKKLIQLDRLKIIELLPRNKIRLLVASNFAWLPKGPIQQFFQTYIAQEYFKTQFADDEEYLIVLNGMLSKQSHGEYQRKLKKLAQEFNDINDEDAGIPLHQKNGTTVVLAMRSWRYGLFEPMLRENKKEKKNQHSKS